MTLLKRLQADAVAKFETQIRVQYINQTDLENVITNTVTAVLDEVEREVEAGDLTRKFMESLEHPTPEEYYAYNQGIADIKTIIGNLKRTNI
jgi:transcriptional regulator NrdR family protein